MSDPDVVPYFTWDAPLTVAQIRTILLIGAEGERLRLLGKILREARDTDVWAFTTPSFVSHNWRKLRPYLGRRRAFWEWLLGRWKEDGLLGG